MQVRNLLDQPQVRARLAHAARFGAGESANVHLVDHRLVQAAAQVAIALPVELVADDHALRRPNDPVLGRQEVARQGLGVGVDQPGTAVETQPLVGLVGSVGLEVIELAGPDAGHEDAPDVAPAVQLGVELDRSRPAPDRPHGCTASTRIAVARRLNTTNCTPPSWTIAPYGRGWENRNVNGRSVIETLSPQSRPIAPTWQAYH